MDGVTATSPITPTSGTQVFSDDFHDPGSGWLIGQRNGVSYSYKAGGYQVVATGAYHYFAIAPYTEPLSELALSVTATQNAGAPPTGGFGLTCASAISTQAELHYEFVVNARSRWYVERRDGPPAVGSGPAILRQGSSPVPPGSKPLTLSAVCATLPDGKTTRLVLFVNSQRVADLMDVASAGSAAADWTGELLTAGGNAAPTTVHVSRFTESSLGGPPPSRAASATAGNGSNT